MVTTAQPTEATTHSHHLRYPSEADGANIWFFRESEMKDIEKSEKFLCLS